jgi:hypothetical protein
MLLAAPVLLFGARARAAQPPAPADLSPLMTQLEQALMSGDRNAFLALVSTVVDRRSAV